MGPADFFVAAPSKDSWLGVGKSRAFIMLVDSLAARATLPLSDGLSFTHELKSSHEGGPRGYDAVRPYIEASGNLAGKHVIIVDDIVTTGGTLLACHDALVDVGASVVGAIACGLTATTAEIAFKPRRHILTDHTGAFDA